MELFILFFTFVYIALFLLPISLSLTVITWLRVALRKRASQGVRPLLLAGATSAAGVGLLIIAIIYGLPVHGMGVLGLGLLLVLVVSAFLTPILYAVTNSFSRSVIISAVVVGVVVVGLSALIIPFIDVDETLLSLLGALLVGAALIGLGLLPWLISRLQMVYRIAMLSLILLWLFIGVGGWVYFATESEGLEKFTGDKRGIAQQELLENSRGEITIDTLKWRVTNVETRGSHGYYVRLETYFWMRIPVNIVHVHTNRYGEKSTRWEKTWWEKWIP